MITGNEPAKPTHYSSEHKGLTIRQHFAAMAMQGLLAKLGDFISEEKIAKVSLEYADALIAELNKEK